MGRPEYAYALLLLFTNSNLYSIRTLFVRNYFYDSSSRCCSLLEKKIEEVFKILF